MATNSDEPEGSVERISDYDRMLERRITILETRWDATLPTLATKADLAELKAELKDSIYSESSKLTRWLVSLTVTMIFGFATLFATMLTLLRP
ncbi:MAG TPA: hypothetical protein VNT33_02665 [Telluria sp.]|nr:hypothetical protein [Telluria sp.]